MSTVTTSQVPSPPVAALEAELRELLGERG